MAHVHAQDGYHGHVRGRYGATRLPEWIRALAFIASAIVAAMVLMTLGFGLFATFRLASSTSVVVPPTSGPLVEQALTDHRPPVRITAPIATPITAPVVDPSVNLRAETVPAPVQAPAAPAASVPPEPSEPADVPNNHPSVSAAPEHVDGTDGIAAIIQNSVIESPADAATTSSSPKPPSAVVPPTATGSESPAPAEGSDPDTQVTMVSPFSTDGASVPLPQAKPSAVVRRHVRLRRRVRLARPAVQPPTAQPADATQQYIQFNPFLSNRQ